MARSRARAKGLRAHSRGCNGPEAAKKCTAELAGDSLFDTARRKSHLRQSSGQMSAVTGRSCSPHHEDEGGTRVVCTVMLK